jgi:hypothetical protein
MHKMAEREAWIEIDRALCRDRGGVGGACITFTMAKE